MVDYQNLKSAPHKLGVDFQNLKSTQHKLGVDYQHLKSAPHKLGVDFQNLKSTLHKLGVDFQKLKSIQHSLWINFRNRTTIIGKAVSSKKVHFLLIRLPSCDSLSTVFRHNAFLRFLTFPLYIILFTCIHQIVGTDA